MEIKIEISIIGIKIKAKKRLGILLAKSNLDLNKPRVFKFTVIEAGGEYTAGSITDPETVKYVKEKIDDGEMGSYVDLANGDTFDANSFNDKLHHDYPLCCA